MSYNLFLDDERQPNKFLNDVRAWVVVRNYTAFVEVITRNGLPNFISFDHDLADEHYVQSPDSDFKERTGYDCAKWLIEYCMNTAQNLPEFQVHSMNPVGRVKIQSLLSSYKKVEQETDYE